MDLQRAAWVQSDIGEGTSTAFSLAFSANVQPGSIILVFDRATAGPVTNVTDTQNNKYRRILPIGVENTFNLWVSRPVKVGGACTVTCSSGNTLHRVIIVEYRGVGDAGQVLNDMIQAMPRGRVGLFDAIATPWVVTRPLRYMGEYRAIQVVMGYIANTVTFGTGWTSRESSSTTRVHLGDNYRDHPKGLTTNTGGNGLRAYGTNGSGSINVAQIALRKRYGPTAFEKMPWLNSVGATQFQQSAAGTLSSAGAVEKQTSRALSSAITSSGALVKQTQRPLAGSISFAGALAAVKTALISLTGTLSMSGALLKSTGKITAGTIASSGSLVKTTSRALIGVISFAGACVKQTRKVLTGALTVAGALAAVKTALISLSGTLTMAGALSKQTQKSLGGTITSTGALVRLIAKVLGGTIAPIGELIKRTARALAGTLSSSGTFAGQLLGVDLFDNRAEAFAAREQHSFHAGVETNRFDALTETDRYEES